ncbi:SDR family oxidoreductase [Microlunatus soli]|uniref:Short-chain dehydrogenase n=1 Tax=Microlunatus soli TaxID=630515 RepID=A0A1H1XVH1_9ACTN|nr:SDR family oxidoreductase [Microlunatus soli]SDT13260.1 Short-chain dehydrogenase [Microlunatus soli]
MKIAGSTALVTGANRGLGRVFAEELLERGATKVYATARRPESVDMSGVEVLRLDITDPDSVAAAAAVAGDVDLLINNAGIATAQNVVTGDPDALRAEIDTHLFGTLSMVKAFAPALARNGGGAIVNLLSVVSWRAIAGNNAYHVAKAAEWALTNSIRLELAEQGTLVTGLHLGATDTDMMRGFGWDIPMNDPADVVSAALDGVEHDELEVLADDSSRQAKAALAEDPRSVYRELTGADPLDLVRPGEQVHQDGN